MSTQSQILSCFSDGEILPKMIVFDLDYTLWPFWVDTHVTPPLKSSNGSDCVEDCTMQSLKFYSDVPKSLVAIKDCGIKIGIASRTSAPDLARQMLNLLRIRGTDGQYRKAIEYLDQLEIYPGSKITHFKKMQLSTGLRYEDMLFFDDEARNKNVETLGVIMYLVRDGISNSEIDNGIKEWRRRRATCIT